MFISKENCYMQHVAPRIQILSIKLKSNVSAYNEDGENMFDINVMGFHK